MSLPPRSKKLICCVRPGVLDIRANVLRPVSEFIRLDLPTLDLPANATSFNPLKGIVSIDVAPTTKVHC